MTERDYTGVATRELKTVFDDHFSPPPAFETWARLHGFSPDVLRRTVLKPQYSWVCLDTADKVVVALGLNLSALVLSGDLTIIPASGKTAAVRMVKDDLGVLDGAPLLSDEEIERRVQSMISLREARCGPLTEYQQEIAKRDDERVARRKQQKSSVS